MQKLRGAIPHNIPGVWAWGVIPWLCVTFSAYSYLVASLQAHTLARQLLIISVCSIGAAFIVFPLVVWTSPWIGKLERKEKTGWIIASLVAGAILLYAIPIPVPGLFFGAPPHTIKIRATGQKNPASQGSEVWLLSADDSIACQIPFRWLRADPAWKLLDNYFVSKHEQPGNLLWSGYFSDRRCRLVFSSHPWSGFVRVTLNGKFQVFDLYAPVQDKKEILLEIPKNFSLFPGLVSRISIIGSLGFLIQVASLWLVNRKVSIEKPGRGWKYVFIYALPLGLWWGLYWFVFYPGLMSVDSLVQWRQSTTGIIDNWHPAFHTLTITWLRLFWNSPAVVVLAQIICLAILGGVALQRLAHYGASRKLIWITLIIFMICPANSFYVLTLWKDVSYSIALLGFFICFAEIVYTKGAWVDHPLNSMLLVFGGLLASLYRHNGSLTIWLCLAALVIFMPQKRSKFAWLLAFTVLLWWITTGPFYTVSGIKPMPAQFRALIPVHHIAAHLAADTPLTADEEAFLNKLRPTQDHWSYTCYIVDPSIKSERFDYSYLAANMRRLTLLAIELALRDPKVELKHMLCVGNELWRFSHPYDSYIYTVPLVVRPDGLSSVWKNDQGINHTITAPVIEKALIKYHAWSSMIGILWLTWRPALYFYLFLFGVVIASIRKRDPGFLLLAIPVIAQVVVIFILALAQDFRYHYPVLLISMLYTPYLLFGVPQNAQELE